MRVPPTVSTASASSANRGCIPSANAPQIASHTSSPAASRLDHTSARRPRCRRYFSHCDDGPACEAADDSRSRSPSSARSASPASLLTSSLRLCWENRASPYNAERLLAARGSRPSRCRTRNVNSVDVSHGCRGSPAPATASSRPRQHRITASATGPSGNVANRCSASRATAAAAARETSGTRSNSSGGCFPGNVNQTGLRRSSTKPSNPTATSAPVHASSGPSQDQPAVGSV